MVRHTSSLRCCKHTRKPLIMQWQLNMGKKNDDKDLEGKKIDKQLCRQDICSPTPI